MSQQLQRPERLALSESPPAPQRVNGTIQHVDTVLREIIVLLPAGPARFDVPSECAILLRGEPIKLRVIQSGDHVGVTFIDCQGTKLAQILEVPPNSASSATTSQVFAAGQHPLLGNLYSAVRNH